MSVLFKPDPSLPSNSSQHGLHADGVRILPKPLACYVAMNMGRGNRLAVRYHDGVSKELRISKRVAEVLQFKWSHPRSRLSWQVGLPPAWKPTSLNVMHSAGDCEGLPISNRVAEVLLALGCSAEG